MERDHRLQADIVCPTVWPCYQDTTMTHMDDWLGKPPLCSLPMKLSVCWSPDFGLPIRSLDHHGCLTKTQGDTTVYVVITSYFRTV